MDATSDEYLEEKEGAVAIGNFAYPDFGKVKYPL